VALSLTFLSGPAGIDGGVGVSGWVSPQTIASSWDPNLVALQSENIALEFKKKGYNALFGPTTGPLGRTVWGGRVFEGFVSFAAQPQIHICDLTSALMLGI
jgi:beta-glucosidase